MTRALIIGYGNIDRADDGVAYEVINALRRHQGREPLGDEETGLEGLGAEVDTVFLSQLTPELMELLCDYDQVVFVDAHVYEEIDALHCQAVTPESTPAILTHHLTPGMMLALMKAIYDREPLAQLVSVRGYDFDFHRCLSPATAALTERAVVYIRQWLADCGHGEGL